MELSVIAPLLDEEGSLEELHRRLTEVLNGREYEIIFIDDGSKDNSPKILKSLKESDARVGLVTFRRNFGKSAALAEGFYRARGDIVITIDADLQDDPNEIPNLLRKLDEGYDLVSGWKVKRRDPLSKTVPSRLFNRITALLSGIPLHDFNCGLKAYRRAVIKNINVYGQLHRFLPVLAKMEGYSIGEIEVVHHPRRFGRTKFGVSRFLYGFLDLLTVLFITRYTRQPMHLFGFLGISALIAGVIINLYLTVLWFQGFPIAGRPLFFLGILLILLGVQSFAIGLLGEMIARFGTKDAAIGEFQPPRV
ncbi:MAG: glycosyltransferase family 2 protein [candidate division Zixibacteria bacterium]|nr:glycosyltransferase family 2 protein [Candidatus Tariuqbacter arcticus]